MKYCPRRDPQKVSTDVLDGKRASKNQKTKHLSPFGKAKVSREVFPTVRRRRRRQR